MVASCVFVVIASLLSFWHRRSGPCIVIIDWMLARSMSRSMHVVGTRVATQWLEVGNAGDNVSVGCCCRHMVNNLLAIDFFYGRLYIAVSTRGAGERMNEAEGCLFPSSSPQWPCQIEDDTRYCREVGGCHH